MKRLAAWTIATHLILMCHALEGNNIKILSYPVLYEKKHARCYTLTDNGSSLVDVIRENETNNIFFSDPSKTSGCFFSIKNNVIQFQNSMLLFDLYGQNYLLIEPNLCFFNCFSKSGNSKENYNIKSKFKILKGNDSFFIYQLTCNSLNQKSNNIFMSELTCWSTYDEESYIEIKFATSGFLSIAINESYHWIMRTLLIDFLKKSNIQKEISECR